MLFSYGGILVGLVLIVAFFVNVAQPTNALFPQLKLFLITSGVGLLVWGVRGLRRTL